MNLQAVDGLTSRIVVSTVFESPPFSSERPSREVMLPLCWSKRDPTCLTADDKFEVCFCFKKVKLLPAETLHWCWNIRLLPSEEHCRRCRPCQVQARPLAPAGCPQPVVDQVPAKERTIMFHPFTFFIGKCWITDIVQLSTWLLGSHLFADVTIYLLDTQDNCQGKEDFLGHPRFLSKSENIPFIQFLVWWSIFTSQGFPK